MRKCWLFAALFIPFVYLASYAEQEANVLLSESSTLMVILGLSNTFGRLLAGFLSDNPWVDPLMMNNVALMIAGAFTMFVPLFKSYYLLVGYVIVFGCGVGNIHPLLIHSTPPLFFSVADLGEGRTYLSGIRPIADPKGPPFVLF